MVVLVVVGTGAALVYGSRYIPDGKLDSVKNAANQVQPFISNNIQHANIGQLGQYGGQLTSSVQALSGKVLGVSTSKSADSTDSATASDSAKNQSLPQKTFEFARYSYCQEVIREYESR